MKTFLLKSTLFLLGLVGFVQILAYVAEKNAPEGTAHFLKQDQLQMNQVLQQSANIEALVLGNSHAGAIDLEALGYEGYGFVRPSGDFFEHQALLKELIPQLPKTKVVLIPVSYFSFQENNALLDETKIRRAHMYTILSSWYFLAGDAKNFVIGKSHPIFPIMSVLREDNWKAIFYAFFDSSLAAKASNEQADYEQCKYLEFPDWVTHSKFRVLSHATAVSETVVANPQISTEVSEVISQIIQYLQARHVRVIFFTPPHSKAYTEVYQATQPKTIALMKEQMHKFQQDNKIEYYDFSTDEDFSLNNQAFRDSDHLNRCGAKLFSAKFKKILAENKN